MASIIEALESLAAKGWYKEWQKPAWKQFMLTGDEGLLKFLPKFSERTWLPTELLSALPGPDQIEDSGRRFLRGCHAAGHPQAIGVWMQQCLNKNAADKEQFSKAAALVLGFGCPQLELAKQVAKHVRPLRQPDGSPTAAGQFLLSLEDKTVGELYCMVGGNPGQAPEITALFVAHAPKRWKALLEKFNSEGNSKRFDPSTWVQALEAAPVDFLEPAAKAFELLDNWYSRFEVGAKLHELNSARFGPAMEKLATSQLLANDTHAGKKLWGEAKESAEWLVMNRGVAALPHLREYFAAPLGPGDWHRKSQGENKGEVLAQAVQKLGREALPLLEACFAVNQPEVQLKALQLWAGIKVDADLAGITAKLRQLFAAMDYSVVSRGVRLAGDLALEPVEQDLWSLLSHKSRPIREAAATTLAKLGESRLPKANELWKARQADTRLAAVMWLKAVGTAKATGTLRARLDEEEVDDVRDAILLALEKLEGGSMQADPAALRERMKKTLAKIAGPPVAWLDPQKLPAPKLKNGSKLPADSLLYLLHRQSRVKDMRADIEAKPLFAQLDRNTSGELALAVLQAFFASEAEADDRWTMAFAAILGDDRLVPVFSRQIKEWADNMRGKLAEYAVQALALLGTDSALLAVDAMAIRYRSKNKNIGKAASEAFANAAQARGLTVEELGDLVVPWLGFEPGKARVVDTGKAKIEARISGDFKLAFRDLATALEKVDADLPPAVLRYVLDGEGEEIVERVANTPGVGAALGLVGPRSGIGAMGRHAARDGSVRGRFFQEVRCSQAGFFKRLGRIYEAASKIEQANQAKAVAQFAHLAALLPQPTFGSTELSWLEMLLIEASQLKLNEWPRRCRSCPALSAAMIEAILKLEGHPPELLIRAAFQPALQRFSGAPLEVVFVNMAGVAESAVRHKGTLQEILHHPDFKQRLYALEMMKKCNVPVAEFAPVLAELSLGSSKQVREQSRLMLVEISSTSRPLIEEKIRSGENDERVHGVELLWRWEGEKARAFLESHLADEKNKKVAQTIKELLVAATPDDGNKVTVELLTLPPLPDIPKRSPLAPETEKAWFDCFDQVNQRIAHFLSTNPKHHYARNVKPFSSAAIRQAFAELAEGQGSPILSELPPVLCIKEAAGPLKTFWQRPELQQVHLVRFLVQTGGLKPDSEANDRYALFGYWLESLVTPFHRAHPDLGLRGLAAAFTAVGLDPARIGRGLLGRFGSAMPYGMSRNQVWPYWLEHLNLLEEAFAPPGNDYMERYHQRQARAHAFEVMACFPHPPQRLLPLLWNLALGPKSERPEAQACLASIPDKAEHLIQALATGSAESRSAAAEWLSRLGEKEAIQPLLAALQRERNEAAKGAMMLALEALGASVDQFLDRAGLLNDAGKNATKAVPEDLKWFPFHQVPPVHWADNGNEVAPVILRWWIIQGFKLKSPEPGALLRRYCASIKQTEREALGQFILEAWIAEDTAPIPRADAEARAQTQAQQTVHYAQYVYQQAQKNPQIQATAQPPLSVQQYYSQILPTLLKQPKGSAVASKGVLSVAGACVGAGAAPVVNRYLKEWYGQRAAQCKALLQMIAWVEHRTASQLLLAIGSRFRTKSIQEEASALAQALAERKGWTVAELGDRTIPSAGLDDNEVLTIDYGPRQFTAKLDEDLEFVLSDADGKAIKSLPDPRKDDDETKAAEAKKMFSAVKKELKSVIAMQRDRFYEAMCTQRTWPFEDWSLYLNRHPIVRHHCQRLVWAIIQNEKATCLFRPLADGSLTDVADEPVVLKDGDQVRVAHECQVKPEESRLWREHLKDYNVESLFEQFGRSNFELSEKQKVETDLSEFEGHLLEAFKFRGRANKLGYTHGQAQDGGWFFEYHKRFSTLGLQATIEFTGNGLPEENRTVALTHLHFDRLAAGQPGGGQEKLLLSEVPPVLLSECWNDIRTIAAEGPGFDPGWEKKTSM